MKFLSKGVIFVSLFTSSNIVYAENMENPLFMAKEGEIYSRTSLGMMFKVDDESLALKLKNQDHAKEWPIWRGTEEFGFGITDRLNLWGALTYTIDNDIDRRGLSQGRVGFIYRAADDTQPMIFDIYGDFHMGGLLKMEAELEKAKNGTIYDYSWNYKNYTTGKYGVFAGVRAGKIWNNFTLAGLIEALYSFGNSNNKITVGDLNGLENLLPDEFSVRLGDSTEINTGLEMSYQFNDEWSLNGGFLYKYHSNNHVDDVYIDLSRTGPYYSDISRIVNGFKGSLNDSWRECIWTISTGYQLTDAMQILAYFEYTLDTSNEKSQNGTDFKGEWGTKINLKF